MSAIRTGVLYSQVVNWLRPSVRFYVMVLRATLQPFSATQIEAALPDAKWQAVFKQLKEK